ncbi:MAG: hypothetical protein WC934_13335 [Acidithiobacillus sp.]|jgi:hypothetical protein|uniref:hypothetical protein n=1 Tax=Acidithiobacillus sp. TaxID=1872118 RepID=UPI00355F09B9
MLTIEERGAIREFAYEVYECTDRVLEINASPKASNNDVNTQIYQLKQVLTSFQDYLTKYKV